MKEKTEKKCMLEARIERLLSILCLILLAYSIWNEVSFQSSALLKMIKYKYQATLNSHLDFTG